MNIKDIIPNDWKLVRLSEITELITKGTTPTTNGYPYLDDGVNFVKVESIHANGTFLPKMFAHVGEDCHNSFKRSQLRSNDILFTIAGALGRSAIVNNEILPANTNQAVAIIRLKNAEYLNYIFHYLRGNYVKNLIDKINVSTAQANLNLGQINQFEIPLPPHQEQKKIAEILSTVDDKIEVIDQQIIETQALKKGLMQRLLTKGIGHTEFKDSPLGMIPKSWEVVNVQEITKEHKQGFYTKDGYVDNGIRLARITDLNNPKVDFSDMPKLNISNSDYQSYKIEKGDFLFARSGAIGRYGIVENEEYPAVFASYLIRFRFNADIINRFFGYFFESYLCENQLRGITQGNANVNINAENIKSLKFPLAPFEEQQKIASIILSVDDKISILKEKKEIQQELKQGLMQQLLTGKIRVTL